MKRWMSTLAVVLVMLGLTPVCRATTVEGNWKLIRVGAIEVYTDGDERRAEDLAKLVSLLKRSLGAFRMVEPQWERPLRLYVFDSYEGYLEFNILGRPASAYSTASDVAVMIAMTSQVPVQRGKSLYDAPGETLCHEYVHAYLADHAPLTPLWLNEGLAEFFRTYRADKDHVYIGKGIPSHIFLLERQGQYLPLARLITRDQSDSDYHGGGITSLFYAQSWANVHWLMLSKEGRQGLSGFLKAVHAGAPELPSFASELEPVMPRQGGQLRNYVVQHDLPSFTLRRKDDATDAVLSREDLDQATAELRLAELMMCSRDPGPLSGAESLLRASLQRDPGSVEARLGLARVFMARDDYEAAVAELEPVVEQDGANLTARAMLGHATLWAWATQEGEDAWESGREPAPEQLKARAILQDVVDAGAPIPPAYFAYAATFLPEADPTPGVQALEQAMEAAPWYDGAYELLIQLYCSSGDLASARSVLDEHLRHRQEVTERYETEMLVVSGEIAVAKQDAGAGRQDEAAMLLIRALRPTDFDVVRDFIRRALAELEVDLEYQRFIQVLDLDHGGDLTGAQARLDGLIPDITHPELALEAQDLRTELALRTATGD